MRFAILWSALAVVSYTAYLPDAVSEKPVWLWIEYLAVYGFMIYEIVKNRKDFFNFGKYSGAKTPI